MKPPTASASSAVTWDACSLKRVRCGVAAADPNREHRLSRTKLLTMLLGNGDDRFCRIEGRRKSGWHVHDQDGIVGAIRQQLLERCGITCTIGVTGDVDRVGARPDRRQRLVEVVHRGRRNVGEFAAKIGEAIHRKHADAAAVGQNGQPIAGQCRQAPKRFRSSKQLVKIEDAQQPGTVKRRIVDRVRAGQALRCGSQRPWRPRHDGPI